ncbi:velvet factor-domain-containing protein [Irpex rosettiformis]|uniref:Velvet factor-domain-containing protein n=1 Tax=Irpex rosettiformis TaxID=378272 RepID=A0ACB8U4A0_9APHY|nr:velvet factor-domain-containing protein [Irpex rosettiformis]
MIQKVNNSPQQPAPALNSWGSWSPESPYGRRYYSLEVVQNPIRARMCGFGDKDRRPLAPAAVAKMHVQRPDSSLVDVDEVDCSFFLVTVDLWSADGTKEMNLVLHPTSADRYTPANAPKSKRRATTSSTAPPSQPSEAQSPIPPTPSTSQYPTTSGMTPYLAPTSPSYSQQGYPFTPETASVQDSTGYQTYGPQEASSSWNYPSQGASQPYGPPTLPSIHTSMGTNETPGAIGESTGADTYSNDNTANESWQVSGSTRPNGDGIPYRSWPTNQQPYTSLDDTSVSHGQEVIDPALRPSQIQPSTSQHPTWSTASVDPYASRYVSVPNAVQPASASHPTPSHHTSPVETSMYASASYAQQQQEQQHQQQAQAQSQNQFQQGQSFARESTPPSTIPPLPRHTYTRTLVGPLSANACRLLDEHRKPGIFFLFQDLSIRTEGTFRLRLRLMNVGAPPAPDLRAYGVHTDQTPVLAQTFTEPFVVFSAKRFPGVPDTTALSIALGNQGQKLPLRNRNNKQGRKRQRNGSDESGEDSD